MKKLMLSTAVAAFAFVVSPAFAQDDSGVKLNLGGHFKGYVNYSDEDDVQAVDILRDTEVHFGGETTLDNGLTVGAHIEAEAGGQGNSFEIDESYIYMAGSWGRINFGDEDGAAYLLQVAAPSADENIDGIRQFVGPAVLTAGLDYDNDFAGDADKITYLTPVFSGFQAGVSYTPTVEAPQAFGNDLDDEVDSFSDAWEASVRYEGTFNTVGLILGAGYTHASLEDEGALTDDFNEWNVGADFDIGAFGIGAIYTENNAALDDEGDVETYAVGVDYTTGPFKLGASYLNNEEEVGVDTETDRYTAGVVYTYGPGMSFRGSVGYNDVEVDGGDDDDATTVTIGTQINF